MQRSLELQGIDAAVVYWEDLLINVQTNNVTISCNGQDLLASRPELVIALGWYKNGKRSHYRDLAFSVALYLESIDVPYWNHEMGRQRSISKLSTMVKLALEDVPVPQTLYSITTSSLADVLPRPFIAKAASASRGTNNFLVKEDDDWRAVTAAGVPMIVQPFLPNDHDLRVICFGGEPSLVLRRSRRADATTHLNNTSQGAEADWQPLEYLSAEALTMCRKIGKIMGREMAGIDLIPDSTSDIGYSCLEVNAIPQLTSGTDADKKLTGLAEAIFALDSKELLV